MSPTEDAPLPWGPYSSFPKTPPGLPAQRPTLAPTQGSGIHSSPQRQGDSHQGPRARGAQGSACLEPRGFPRESAHAGCGKLPSFLPAGLFQELVLLRGDPCRVMPRAEWHLPAEGAAELPLAHELPWEQVSETVWIRSAVVEGLGLGLGGSPGPQGWVDRGPAAHFPAPPVGSWATLEGFLGEDSPIHPHIFTQ